MTTEAADMNALYSLYDALVSINVPSDKARAVVDSMERDMTTLLATKSDLAATQLLLKKDIDSNYALLKQDMELLRSSMTIRLGSMLAVTVGLVLGGLRLML
jgi:hypothetical protein